MIQGHSRQCYWCLHPVEAVLHGQPLAHSVENVARSAAGGQERVAAEELALGVGLTEFGAALEMGK